MTMHAIQGLSYPPLAAPYRLRLDDVRYSVIWSPEPDDEKIGFLESTGLVAFTLFTLIVCRCVNALTSLHLS